MNSDRLQKWALVAEIVGGLAVVLSLIFVGLEIRQSSEETALNTRAVETGAYQDLIGQIMAINFNTQNNAQLRELINRMIDGGEFLTEEERDLYNSHVTNIMRHADLAYFQYERGIIDKERLQSATAIYVRHLSCSQFARNMWIAARSPIEEFRIFIDQQVEAFTDSDNYRDRC